MRLSPQILFADISTALKDIQKSGGVLVGDLKILPHAVFQRSAQVYPLGQVNVIRAIEEEELVRVVEIFTEIRPKNRDGEASGVYKYEVLSAGCREASQHRNQLKAYRWDSVCRRYLG